MKSNISSLFGIGLSDDRAIAEKLSEMNQTETGIDEKGIYELSFVFKDGLIEQCQKKIERRLEKLKLFDYYNIFDLQITNDLLKMIDGYDRFPDVIITSDFEIIRAPKAFMNIDESSNNYQESLNWKKSFKETLKEYSNNSFSLILDCHI
ncbi:MAG: hypothetical protein WC523_07430 [Patescibacteria group bacterium]